VPTADQRPAEAADDAKGVIQIFNVGAERVLGYTAAEVVNTITAADLHFWAVHNGVPGTVNNP
jgi:hypothetical protein